jgi:hypothetical protein
MTAGGCWEIDRRWAKGSPRAAGGGRRERCCVRRCPRAPRRTQTVRERRCHPPDRSRIGGARAIRRSAPGARSSSLGPGAPSSESFVALPCFYARLTLAAAHGAAPHGDRLPRSCQQWAQQSGMESVWLAWGLGGTPPTPAGAETLILRSRPYAEPLSQRVWRSLWLRVAATSCSQDHLPRSRYPTAPDATRGAERRCGCWGTGGRPGATFVLGVWSVVPWS